MLDHAGFAVSDIARSRAFYEAALAPLGFSVIMDTSPEQNAQGGGGRALGFGTADNPFFWIADNQRVGEGTHIAFTAASRAEIDPSMPLPWPLEAATMAGRVYVRPITRTIMRRSCSIRTGSTSKRSATSRNEHAHLHHRL